MRRRLMPVVRKERGTSFPLAFRTLEIGSLRVMKIRLFGAAIVIGLTLVVSTAWAGPRENKLQRKGDTPCAGKRAESTASSATCDGRSEATADAKPGCGGCQKAAATKSTCSGDCGGNCDACKQKAAEKAGCGQDCSKGCGGSQKAALTKSTCDCGGNCDACKQKAAEKTGCGQDCSKGCGGSQKAALTKSTCSGDCDGNCAACKEKAAMLAKSGGGCDKGCSGCSQQAGKDAEGGCPISKKVDAMLASMPSVKYRVGNEVTGCSKRAASLAESNGHDVEYVVGDETYTKQGKAVVRAADLLEEESKTLRKMTYVVGGESFCCAKSAARVAEKTKTDIKYRVGGFDFSNEADAKKALVLMNEALGTVSVSYMVDGHSYDCDKAAGNAAQQTGSKMTFLVGDREASCKDEAELMLSEARIRAIIEAAAKVYASSAS